ncbi:Aminoglycoside 3 -phosphotransferase [Pyrenophora seminiperda CCB06]|uniref:Aminoglycoside 3-phosphotransferase n=1 Tax=Pyrenophora seminiperda CCB06 TaxID=1302712 RepID=A0A3M7MC00_9PLEO|nr:Aminoglycoside 3 -phosphotransferase [Pyrenophora seminiperda CCB06]
MNYVQTHTSIPLPIVLDVNFDETEGEESWIIMTRLPGCQLGEAWPSMTNNAKAQTTSQLKSHFKQLHRLHPPEPAWIGSRSHGPAYDHRLDNRATCGPFASVGEFHDFLVAPVKNSPCPD